jgi:hypothetical protein
VTIELVILFWLAAIVVAGLAGSLLIMSNLSGRRAFGAFGLWLPVPFVVLAVMLSVSVDPTLPEQQQAYNFQLAFVLVAFAVAIPWSLANLVGGLTGRGMRRRRMASLPASPTVAPLSDAGLPDWRHYDQPSLTLSQLGELMHAIAQRAGIDERWLPHVGAIAGRDGVFIDRDKFDYIYCELERGGAMFDHRVVVADQLMYLIFKDRAWALATTHMAHNRTTRDRYHRLHAERQQAILAGIDPRWGNQFALEHDRQAGG